MKFTRTFTLVSSFALTTIFSQPFTFAATKKAERWFEIEVILFSQLNDKSELKEHFSTDGSYSKIASKYKKINDLLTPYLHPEISSLKVQLPICGQSYPQSSIEQLKNYQYFPIHSLEEIAQDPAIQASFSIEQEPLTSSNNNQLPKLTGIRSEESETFTQQADLTIAENYGLSSAQIAELIPQIDQAFPDYSFDYSTELNQQICQLQKDDLTALAENIEGFDPDYFTVEKVPSEIDGKENIDSSTPYLIAKDSLQLDDLYKDLRRSREFRPLLHIGWRQAAVSKRRSVPVHLFAGDNLQAHYQQQLAAYQKAQALELIDENEELVTEVIVEQPETQQQALERQLDYIYQNIANVPDDTQTLLSQLENQTVAQQTTSVIQDKPVEPIQPWYLDGLFNVHLKHYLFITADFSILNKTLAEQITEQLTGSLTNQALAEQLNAIQFKQNRRVISGEIHYFDHPYMGMIVQIRRYKKPEPETTESAQ